ncbi:unnamed protein product [Closterium sp. Yama58-4]|nr:unnamed protein product [Closterium sp. Yama58-4]
MHALPTSAASVLLPSRPWHPRHQHVPVSACCTHTCSFHTCSFHMCSSLHRCSLKSLTPPRCPNNSFCLSIPSVLPSSSLCLPPFYLRLTCASPAPHRRLTHHTHHTRTCLVHAAVPPFIADPCLSLCPLSSSTSLSNAFLPVLPFLSPFLPLVPAPHLHDAMPWRRQTIEIEALQRLWAAPAPVAPPIIRLLATHEDSRHLHIVTDKAQGGDLFMALAARASFTEADAAHIGAWGKHMRACHAHRFMGAIDNAKHSHSLIGATRSSFNFPFSSPPSSLTSPVPPYSPITLSRLMPLCPLPHPSPHPSARQLLQAVALCHARGVTHRDLVSALQGGVLVDDRLKWRRGGEGSVVRWAMCGGPCAVGHVRWAMCGGPCAVGHVRWAMCGGPCAVGHVRWAMCGGPCAVGHVRWAMCGGPCAVGHVRWAMCGGPCAVGHVRWAMCGGPCAVGHVRWAMCGGPCAVGHVRWAMCGGPCAVGHVRWAMCGGPCAVGHVRWAMCGGPCAYGGAEGRSCNRTCGSAPRFCPSPLLLTPPTLAARSLPCGPVLSTPSACQKPENILLSDVHALTIKLVDFGSAALFHPAPAPAPTSGSSGGEAVQGGEDRVVLRDFMGTAFYAAPEVWRHAYGAQADVWSAGAVVAVLLTGPPPSGLTRATVHSNATWQAMQGIVPTLPPETSPAAQSFLQAVLEPDPCKRPTAAQALLHPWLGGTAAGGGEGDAGAVGVAGDGSGHVMVATGASQARAHNPGAALEAGAGQASVKERTTGATSETRDEGTGKTGEKDRERDDERGEREGRVAGRQVEQEEEGVLRNGQVQGGAGAAAEGRVRGSVQLEGSLRGFRLYAATRKLQRACVALLSLELSESEFRQLVRHLATATSAPGTSLEAVSEAGGTVEVRSDYGGQQQYPHSAMLSLSALLASLDALGHQQLSVQLMAVYSIVMAQQHVVPHSTVHVMAGVESDERVRGGSGIAAALGKQRQEQQQQGATSTSLNHQPSGLPPATSSAAIPPVPLFDLVDFSALARGRREERVVAVCMAAAFTGRGGS